MGGGDLSMGIPDMDNVNERITELNLRPKFRGECHLRGYLISTALFRGHIKIWLTILGGYSNSMDNFKGGY